MHILIILCTMRIVVEKHVIYMQYGVPWRNGKKAKKYQASIWMVNIRCINPIGKENGVKVVQVIALMV